MENSPHLANLDELKACFRAFNSLLQRESSASRAEEFNLEAAKIAFSNFGKIQKKNNSGVNIFKLCSLGRDEVDNCRLLAWLLDKNGRHGLGSCFLEKILASSQKTRKKAFAKDALASNYATRTEICPNADNTDRVDIVCESSRMLLYIEVKIDSAEHTVQTDRYYKRLLHNAAGRESELLFISTGDTPVNKNASYISWREIGEIAESMAAETPTSFIGQILEQYSQFIREF